MKMPKVENTSPPIRTSRNTFLVSVIASVVASIIVGIFIQPILASISDFVVSFIGVFYQGWIDGIYRQASGSTLFLAIFFITTFITGIPLFAAIGIMIGEYLVTRTLGPGRLQRAILGRTARIGRRITILGVAVMVPSIFIVNARLYAEFQATATFEHRLMALEPVISDQERKELRGQWALMNSRTDYDRINGRFEELAKKYNAKLPVPYI
jgi:hypothetical protein